MSQCMRQEDKKHLHGGYFVFQVEIPGDNFLSFVLRRSGMGWNPRLPDCASPRKCIGYLLIIKHYSRCDKVS